MKLTRNEIKALVSYYIGLKFDLQDRMDTLRENFHGVIESDLYEMQLNRYKMKLKEYENRIYELEHDTDSL